jgi:threonine dehydrogenase-like Zn-dependent dehydrogenase
MKATMLYSPGDVRVENRQYPMILKPTAAIIRVAATCVYGSGCGTTAHLVEQDQSQQGVRPDLPLEEAADGYRAMDVRTAIKAPPKP